MHFHHESRLRSTSIDVSGCHIDLLCVDFGILLFCLSFDLISLQILLLGYMGHRYGSFNAVMV